MSEYRSPYPPEQALYLGVSQAMQALRDADAAAEQLPWVSEVLGPYMDSAAQGVFVALDRLKKELSARYGDDRDLMALMEPGPENVIA